MITRIDPYISASQNDPQNSTPLPGCFGLQRVRSTGWRRQPVDDQVAHDVDIDAASFDVTEIHDVGGLHDAAASFFFFSFLLLPLFSRAPIRLSTIISNITHRVLTPQRSFQAS